MALTALRRALRPLLQASALAGFCAAGSGLARALRLPVPGPVVGLALLLGALELGLVRLAWVEEGASWLIRHMLLFFIPAAVGVVAYPELLGAAGLRLLALVALSTAGVMVATAAAAEAVARWRAARR